MSRALYVSIRIAAEMQRVWELTQDPAAHPRWDLRFSAIVPLDTGASDAQRFRYERALPGHVIHGTGISLGERRARGGARTSALRFRTDDRLSPLREGRGYWRYLPEPGGVRFVTGYDYTPGWGRIPDLLMRPIVGWMTAWSFDRLRIWAERDEPPEHWPLTSVLWFWRPERPRASRCQRRAPGRGAMHDAPASLATLERP